MFIVMNFRNNGYNFVYIVTLFQNIKPVIIILLFREATLISTSIKFYGSQNNNKLYNIRTKRNEETINLKKYNLITTVTYL